MDKEDQTLEQNTQNPQDIAENNEPIDNSVTLGYMIQCMISVLFPLVIYLMSYNIMYFTLYFSGMGIVLPTMQIGGLCMLTAILSTVWCFPKGELKLSYHVTLPLIMVLCIGMTVFLNYSIMISGIMEESDSFSQAQNSLYGIPFWLQLIIYTILSPIAEEIVFRGALYKRIRRIMPIPAAVILSALAFGLYHGNVVQGIYAFFMGIMMALAYELTGSFLTPVIYHALANCISCIVTNSKYLNELVFSTTGYIISIVLSVLSMSLLLVYAVRKHKHKKEPEAVYNELER